MEHLHTKNLVHCTKSNLLPVSHGMFDRHGGVSSPPYDSLNLSYGVADDPKAVRTNRDLLKKRFAFSSLKTCRQVHGNRIAIIEERDGDQEFDGFDALVSNLPGCGLMIQQADCQAVLLYDPYRLAIGAVHCGWRGSVTGILTRTVATMEKVYRSRPADIRAVISPSLGPCCAEFIHYKKELPGSFHPFQVRDQHFDFWKISMAQLQDSGLRKEHIDAVSICTACSSNYFSYRRASKAGNGVTGRQGSLITLPEQVE